MMRILLGIVLLGLAAPMHAAQWSYNGPNGPEHWGSLSPDYLACKNGRAQSPVNITGALEARTAPLELSYDAAPGSHIVNNGHTVQADFAPGNTLTLDAKRFGLVQVHFHAPAENTIDGRQYPLEAHFVHADPEGNLAVVALMFEQGAPNAALARLWFNMPASEGPARPLQVKVPPASLMPPDLRYYRFVGSLTTPPCSEGVRWLVLATPMQASAEQIQAFKTAVGHANNRPVQPLNGRVVVK